MFYQRTLHVCTMHSTLHPQRVQEKTIIGMESQYGSTTTITISSVYLNDDGNIHSLVMNQIHTM